MGVSYLAGCDSINVTVLREIEYSDLWRDARVLLDDSRGGWSTCGSTFQVDYPAILVVLVFNSIRALQWFDSQFLMLLLVLLLRELQHMELFSLRVDLFTMLLHFSSCLSICTRNKHQLMTSDTSFFQLLFLLLMFLLELERVLLFRHRCFVFLEALKYFGNQLHLQIGECLRSLMLLFGGIHVHCILFSCALPCVWRATAWMVT